MGDKEFEALVRRMRAKQTELKRFYSSGLRREVDALERDVDRELERRRGASDMKRIKW